MKEIEVRDLSRSRLKEFVRSLQEELDAALKRSKGETRENDWISFHIDNLLRLLYNSITSKIQRKFLKTSPFSLAFVYHKEGEVLLKGFLPDVLKYIKDNLDPCFYRLIIYNRNRLYIHFSEGEWERRWDYGSWGSSHPSMMILPPQALASVGSYSRREGDSIKQLRKYRVHIGNRIFYFRRMPNRWIPDFTQAIIEEENKKREQRNEPEYYPNIPRW